MVRRTANVSIGVALAAAIAGALYWAFLNVPESRTLAIVLSAALLLAIVVVIATSATAVILLALDEPRASSLKHGVRRAPAFLAAAVAGAVLVWLVLLGDGWVTRHSGEINAWFIATLNWSDISLLFRLEGWVSTWLRWVAIPAGVLAVTASMLQHGAAAAASTRWMRAAWGWRTLAVATAAFVLLIVLPWRFGSRPPGAVPPASLEPALVALRLGLVGAAMAVGTAFIVLSAARATRTR